jgi:hypothetical protein
VSWALVKAIGIEWPDMDEDMSISMFMSIVVVSTSPVRVSKSTGLRWHEERRCRKSDGAGLQEES